MCSETYDLCFVSFGILNHKPSFTSNESNRRLELILVLVLVEK